MATPTPESTAAAPEALGGSAARAGRTEELRLYVEAFRASSDRARNALYLVLIAATLVAVANYNFQEWSWPNLRLRTWYQYARDGNGPPAEPGEAARRPEGSAGSAAAAAPAARERPQPRPGEGSAAGRVRNPVPEPGKTPATEAIPREILGGDPMLLKNAREEYIRQFIARAVFNPLPITTAAIDINDVSFVGGIVLNLLMLVLLVSLAREHANLYLALFKVRLLHGSPAGRGEECMHRREEGDSEANLLYHALAMSQVLDAPSTLARWKTKRPFVPSRLGLVFFVPALSHFWTVPDKEVVEVAVEYGAAPDLKSIMLFYGVPMMLTVALVVWGALAWAISHAMAGRWESAFRRINPSRQYVEPPPLRSWWRLRRRSLGGDDLGKVTADLVDLIEVDEPPAEGIVDVRAEAEIARLPIAHGEAAAMARRLREQAEAGAKALCQESLRGTFIALRRFDTQENCLHLRDRRWIVAGEWTFAYDPQPPEPAGEAASTSA